MAVGSELEIYRASIPLCAKLVCQGEVGESRTLETSHAGVVIERCQTPFFRRVHDIIVPAFCLEPFPWFLTEVVYLCIRGCPSIVSCWCGALSTAKLRSSARSIRYEYSCDGCSTVVRPSVTIYLTTRPLSSSSVCTHSTGCSQLLSGPHQHGLWMRAKFSWILVRPPKISRKCLLAKTPKIVDGGQQENRVGCQRRAIQGLSFGAERVKNADVIDYC